MQIVLQHENILSTSVNNPPERDACTGSWHVTWEAYSGTWHLSERRSGHKRLVDKLVVDLRMVACGR